MSDALEPTPSLSSGATGSPAEGGIASASETKKPRRRFFPRFSLRTLTLCVLLAASAFGLWWKWEPWVPDNIRDGSEPTAGSLMRAYHVDDSSTFDDILVRVDNHDWIEVIELRTGKRIAKTEIQPQQVSYVQFAPDGKTFAATGWDDVRIFDTQGAKLLTIVDKDCCYCVKYSEDGKRLFVVCDGFGPLQMKAYSRRRPEQWWGVAWLPEFWLTTTFALLTLWSLVRDFKMLRRANRGGASCV